MKSTARQPNEASSLNRTTRKQSLTVIGKSYYDRCKWRSPRSTGRMQLLMRSGANREGSCASMRRFRSELTAWRLWSHDIWAAIPVSMSTWFSTTALSTLSTKGLRRCSGSVL